MISVVSGNLSEADAIAATAVVEPHASRFPYAEGGAVNSNGLRST